MACRAAIGILILVIISGCAESANQNFVNLSKVENFSGEVETIEDQSGKIQYPETVTIHQESAGRLSEFRNSPEMPSELERSMLPACGQFSSPPVDLTKVIEITPLGNIAPPGHTFPTEHVFFHLTSGGATTETQPLYMAADARVLLISIGRGFTQDPVDYTVYFAPCRDIVAYYNHVKELSPALQSLVDPGECMFPGESKATRCNVRMFEQLSSGALVGRVGRLQGNFDFGLMDLRTTHVFANPSRYGARTLRIQCPFDYYGTERAKFFDLIKRQDKKCGTVAQDIPGTLKGNWFYGSARADMGSDWDKYLAFVDNHENPALQIVSIGGVFTNAGKVEFTPRQSGRTNLDFAKTAPGEIYCYESKAGRVIVQMTNSTSLKIEQQNGSCSESYSFIKPFEYGR